MSTNFVPDSQFSRLLYSVPKISVTSWTHLSIPNRAVISEGVRKVRNVSNSDEKKQETCLHKILEYFMDIYITRETETYMGW